MAVKVTRTFTAPIRGIGKPDYSRQVSKGTQIPGYTLAYGEIYLWLAIICVPAPGGVIVTRTPLAIGESVRLLDAFTGNDQLVVPANWDFVIKQVWISFNQDVELKLEQGGTWNDVSCLAYIKGGEKPVNVFELAWRRSMMEDITEASYLRATLTNLGGAEASGKAWLMGFMKEGQYPWT